MKKTLMLMAILAISGMVFSQSLLPEKWKFNTGDDATWAAPGYNDSGWKEITPGSFWERQGYAGYDGYAWYRVTFTIPSKFRKDAETYGGLTLLLGKIDDAAFT